MRFRFWTLLAFAPALLLATPVLNAAQGDGVEPQPSLTEELGPVFLVALGGKLYDNLWAVLEMAPPTGRNPAFPAGTDVADADTWRCVSCHGWDYRGAEGERARATPGLTAPSLVALREGDPAMIAQRILAPTHPFPAIELPDMAVLLMATFVSSGQYDLSSFFDEAGRAVGNATAGRDVFEGACISCHQLDGRAFLRGETGDRSSLGWVTRNRIEQSLHKTLNGVPAAEMLALRFLDPSQVADLFAYLQLLDSQER